MFLETGDVELTDKQISRIRTIREVYEQQEYMYKTGTHSVKDRIVSISQPYIRPIVRGKAKAPVEFGAKLNISIDENGIARLERISFDAYNEADAIRISGPALGRPKKMKPEEKEQAYGDNIARIGVERGFSQAKRCYGLGLIRTRLDTTTRSSIALSIIAMNLDRLTAVDLCAFLISIFSRYIWQEILPHRSAKYVSGLRATC